MRIYAILLIFLFKKSEPSHFRGGSISWEPIDPFATGTPIQVKITTRFYYIYNRYLCNTPSDIGSGNELGDGSTINSLNGPPWSIFANVYCTNFSIPYQWQAGTREQKATVESGYPITARFTSCCWIDGIELVSGPSWSASWNVDVTIDLSKRDATGRINSSPITTLDLYIEISSDCTGALQQLQIPVSDPDVGDVVRCFCTNNTCLQNFTLDVDTCIITFSLGNGYYAVDITIQDFDVGSNVPKSSIPLQFVVFVSPTGSANCRKKIFIFFNLSLVPYITAKLFSQLEKVRGQHP